MFRFLLEKYMFLFSSFNMIGKGFKHKCKLPEGKIYYLDFYERCVRPVEKNK